MTQVNHGVPWADFSPQDFDATAPPVQLSLMPAPDPLGTPDMFGESR